VIASIVLVIFIQNLLIAYMGQVSFFLLISYELVKRIYFLLIFLFCFFSGMHEKANIEGRQILLRHRARYIADYEALHHIHFWQHELEPKQIYYFGYLKNFEDWFKIIKDDQNAIYEGFEEKSISSRHTFKDYDKFSILEHLYDDDNESKIEKIKNMKNDGNINFEYLIELFREFKDQESDEIEKMKSEVNIKIENLIKKLNN
jgi:hypothetical protein